MSNIRIAIFLTLFSDLFLRGDFCGISTHLEIAHRALQFYSRLDGSVNFKQLILKHQDAYQAGSVYPDAFYPSICKEGRYHDVSEDTHWAPFLNTSVNYIRSNYPQPWGEDTEKLVAFLFGIASHMVADVSWHSLGIEQGFLRTMGSIDFHGSYADAHSVGDFGADVLSQYELDLNYLQGHWYVPVADLMNIYQEFYGRRSITEGAIIDCTYLLFLEMKGEMVAVSTLFPIYAKKSTFLVDRFHDYFLGGLDDMAFWATQIYQLTSFMLENGTSGCYIPENPLFIQCTGEERNSSIVKPQRNGYHSSASSSLMKKVGADIISTGKGVQFRMNSWDSVSSVIKAANALSMKNTAESAIDEHHTHVTKPTASYYVTSPYSKLGWAMASADLNKDGYEDLLVGAPGYSTLGHFQIGRVYIVYSNESGLPSGNMDLDKEATSILQGFQPSARFGSAVAVLDFNNDGIMDVAVGAPSVGSQQLTYKGSVYVYFGAEGSGVAVQPNITINCWDTYCNLGWTLLSADVNGDGLKDLVIGSPYAPGGGKQRGVVAAFYSSASRNNKDRLSLEEAEWMLNGEEDYAWFGYSLNSHKLENQTLLFIGSPTWSNGDDSSPDEKQSLGKVYGYQPPSKSPYFSISGEKEQSKLGSSIASGILSIDGTVTHVLGTGAPTEGSTSTFAYISVGLTQAGKARLYGLRGNTEPSLLSTFSGDRRFSRFGQKIVLSDLENDGLDEVIVASPMRSSDFTLLFGAEAGRVYIYNGNKTSSGHVTDHCKSWISPCPEEMAQYVLISPEKKSRFGRSLVAVKSRQKSQVVVAAERSSWKARLAGVIHVYSL
ncbi:phosphatidylinositol-glycan-specific phospholipase D isoform X2 [Pleurodeles waltl]|uniref:phosphatidylinositol-glycan-specific phospholipase D isoform X2 n=1 Tax=Pleurodeles waltl TaxID=8319 RepID=UPI0037099D78